jgi:energy-coupling factor transporter ATP-binding protein EcfA2/uncharacterized surface protein with fasciclin (FAS1) repeats
VDWDAWHTVGNVRYPSQLAGGQQQRVAIARALIGRPRLLLTDEPTGNLDSTTGTEILDLIDALRAEHGMTVLVATHEQHVAARCERLIRLRDGAVVDDLDLTGGESPETSLDRVGRLRLGRVQTGPDQRAQRRLDAQPLRAISRDGGGPQPPSGGTRLRRGRRRKFAIDCIRTATTGRTPWRDGRHRFRPYRRKVMLMSALRRMGPVPRRMLAVAGAAILAVVLTPSSAFATGGSGTPSGTRPLSQVLSRDTGGLDRRPYDFDILTKAVLTVLAAKPNSPVAVLTDGSVALTAFLPTDAAFQRLVKDITDAHRWPSEQQAFTAVAGLGIDTVEAVLLYHVVPGATIDGRAARMADGAALTTALGSTVTVDVVGRYRHAPVRLIDADRTDRNPRVVIFDINKGNRQIAHAIDRVLRPLDLP